MRFSIVIPVCNIAQYLPECLDSIMDQSFGDFEVVAVDDGSTDDSLAILDRYAVADSRLRVMTQDRTGVAAARNLGLSSAAGDYVLFVDGDDLLAPGALTEIDAELSVDQVDVAIFGYRVAEGGVVSDCASVEPVRLSVVQKTDIGGLVGPLESTGRLKPVWNKAYRREFLVENRLSFPPRRVGEDGVFNLEALMLARSLAVSAGFIYVYRIRQGSATHVFDLSTMADSAVELRELAGFVAATGGPMRLVRQQTIYKACWNTLNIVRSSPRKMHDLASIAHDSDFRELVAAVKLHDCEGRLQYVLALLGLRLFFGVGALNRGRRSDGARARLGGKAAL